MTHKACYGKLFPTVNSPPTNRPIRGKTFVIELKRAGGMMIATRHKLSMAKLALETGAMQN